MLFEGQIANSKDSSLTLALCVLFWSPMDLTKIIEQQKQELTRRLQLLQSNDLSTLIVEKASYQKKIDEIDAKIEHICSELGIGSDSVASKPSASKKERAPRMNGGEITRRILELLSKHPHGLSQKEISDQTGVSYPSVINFVKDNADKLTSTGERKSKRIFLKA